MIHFQITRPISFPQIFHISGIHSDSDFFIRRHNTWEHLQISWERLSAHTQFDRLQASLVKRGREMMERKRDNLPATDADLDRAHQAHNDAHALTGTLAQIQQLTQELDPLDHAFSDFHRFKAKAMQAYDNAAWLVTTVHVETQANAKAAAEVVWQEVETKQYLLQELLFELGLDRKLRLESSAPTKTSDYDAAMNVVEELYLLEHTVLSLRYNDHLDYYDVAHAKAEVCKMIDSAYWLSKRIEEEMNEVSFSSLIQNYLTSIISILQLFL